MKKLLSVLALASIVMVAVSCGNVEKILPKKDGTWQVTYQKTVTTDSATGLSETDIEDNIDSLGTITFDKEGTGHIDDADGTHQDFTWSVNDDNDIVTMVIADSAGSISMDWDVLESSGKEQQWQSTMTISLPPLFSWTIVTDMTMERVK